MTVTLLTQGGSTDNVAAYTTTSVTPTAGKLYLVGAIVSGTNPAPDFTVAGWGLTWEQVTTTAFVARGMKMYAAKGTPTAGALTITAVSGSYTGAGWCVVEADADLSGAAAVDAIQQSKGVRPNGPPISVPFDVTVVGGNDGFAFVGISVAETITPGTGWTGLAASQNVSAPITAFVGMWADSAPQNIEATWTTADTAFVCAVEIKAASSGVTGSGALTAAAVTLSGAGTLTATGSGTPTAPPATLSGTGVLTLTGSGSFTPAAAGLSGTGTLALSGTGALTAATATASGAGTVTATGSGVLVVTPAVATGTGVLTVTGAGDLSAAAAQVSGAALLQGTGTGTLTAPAASLSSQGSVGGAAPRDITLTIGPGRSRSLTATGRSRAATVAAASRTLTATPRE